MTLSLAGPLLLVGAGKMGGALLEGWLRQGLDPAAVFIRTPRRRPKSRRSPRGMAIAAGRRPICRPALRHRRSPSSPTS